MTTALVTRTLQSNGGEMIPSQSPGGRGKSDQRKALFAWEAFHGRVLVNQTQKRSGSNKRGIFQSLFWKNNIFGHKPKIQILCQLLTNRIPRVRPQQSAAAVQPPLV